MGFPWADRQAVLGALPPAPCAHPPAQGAPGPWPCLGQTPLTATPGLRCGCPHQKASIVALGPRLSPVAKEAGRLPVSEELSPDQRAGSRGRGGVQTRRPHLHHPQPRPGKRKQLGEADQNPDPEFPHKAVRGPCQRDPVTTGREREGALLPAGPAPPHPPSRGERGCSLSLAPLRPDTNPAPQGPSKAAGQPLNWPGGKQGLQVGAGGSPPPGRGGRGEAAGGAAERQGGHSAWPLHRTPPHSPGSPASPAPARAAPEPSTCPFGS